MPQAITLGRTSRYVQIIHTDRNAPRIEPLTTREVKGKRRYGEGRSVRLVRSLAVGVGRWTEAPSLEKIQEIEADSVVTWPRLINDEEVIQLRSRFTQHNHDKMREGWTPPLWHWRRWQEFVLPLLNKLGLVDVRAYGDVHLKRPRWLRRKDDGWRPMQVAESEEDIVA